MSNPYFRFKQFTVCHDRCAMKVGTDGVLLGAWTNLSDNQKVLDVGTGSGLISLMFAQRNRTVSIDAIEIDGEANLQANENFRSSPFRNINSSRHISLMEYVQNYKDEYDLIVSNPPFFHRSLLSPSPKRNMARHTDSLLIEDFIQLSENILSPKGRIAFIFPTMEKDYILSLAEENGLYVSRVTDVYPKIDDTIPKRILVEFSRGETVPLFDSLIVEKQRHVYTDEFTVLVKDFYLKY